MVETGEERAADADTAVAFIDVDTVPSKVRETLCEVLALIRNNRPLTKQISSAQLRCQRQRNSRQHSFGVSLHLFSPNPGQDAG